MMRTLVAQGNAPSWAGRDENRCEAPPSEFSFACTIGKSLCVRISISVRSNATLDPYPDVREASARKHAGLRFDRDAATSGRPPELLASVCGAPQGCREPESPQPEFDDVTIKEPCVPDALTVHGNTVYAADVLDERPFRPDGQDGVATADRGVFKA